MIVKSSDKLRLKLYSTPAPTWQEAAHEVGLVEGDSVGHHDHLVLEGLEAEAPVVGVGGGRALLQRPAGGAPGDQVPRQVSLAPVQPHYLGLRQRPGNRQIRRLDFVSNFLAFVQMILSFS